MCMGQLSRTCGCGIWSGGLRRALVGAEDRSVTHKATTRDTTMKHVGNISGTPSLEGNNEIITVHMHYDYQIGISQLTCNTYSWAIVVTAYLYSFTIVCQKKNPPHVSPSFKLQATTSIQAACHGLQTTA